MICAHIQDVHSETGVAGAQTEHVLDSKQLPFVVCVTLDTLEVAAGILRSYGNVVQLLERSRATFPPVRCIVRAGCELYTRCQAFNQKTWFPGTGHSTKKGP